MEKYFGTRNGFQRGVARMRDRSQAERPAAAMTKSARTSTRSTGQTAGTRPSACVQIWRANSRLADLAPCPRFHVTLAPTMLRPTCHSLAVVPAQVAAESRPWLAAAAARQQRRQYHGTVAKRVAIAKNRKNRSSCKSRELQALCMPLSAPERGVQVLPGDTPKHMLDVAQPVRWPLPPLRPYEPRRSLRSKEGTDGRDEEACAGAARADAAAADAVEARADLRSAVEWLVVYSPPGSLDRERAHRLKFMGDVVASLQPVDEKLRSLRSQPARRLLRSYIYWNRCSDGLAVDAYSSRILQNSHLPSGNSERNAPRGSTVARGYSYSRITSQSCCARRCGSEGGSNYVGGR
eukprot:scaffold526_cov108-Isochrysis_galbana.AAC.1